ncbi:actinodefensin-associated protein B [Actinokineospora diospyrosa]|uniref:Mycofactocin binding protein MftB n=1 Tax=Actinokineospora diospyrosa TaxID=103728 RepID=A0ABT1IKD0_9PSEU|nr:actinodefensin-associated protein B [Actinokineospora diospyrosa]MCP2272671.1 hypothetical protein [Actinokineospora diospyrosa]
MSSGLETGQLGLAPGVTLTRLPFGGTVLVAAVTLAVAECGERDAMRLDLLLSQGHTAHPDLRAFAGELIQSGWLIVAGDERGADR